MTEPSEADYNCMKQSIVEFAREPNINNRMRMYQIIVNGESDKLSIINETGTGCAVILEKCKKSTIKELYDFVLSYRPTKSN
jgi:hypothetical protein